MFYQLIFKSDCSNGCPCKKFKCEPDKKSILALNTYTQEKPVLIKYDGKYHAITVICSLFDALKTSTLTFIGGINTKLDFSIEAGSSVFHSCSATMNGEFYVFGGSEEYSRQVP